MKLEWNRWAYLIGIIGAPLFGLLAYFDILPMGAGLTMFLILVGVAIGFMNIAGKESVTFLLSAIALAVISTVFATLPMGALIDAMISSLAKVVAPAGIVVAIKGIVSTAR